MSSRAMKDAHRGESGTKKPVAPVKPLPKASQPPARVAKGGKK